MDTPMVVWAMNGMFTYNYEKVSSALWNVFLQLIKYYHSFAGKLESRKWLRSNRCEKIQTFYQQGIFFCFSTATIDPNSPVEGNEG